MIETEADAAGEAPGHEEAVERPRSVSEDRRGRRRRRALWIGGAAVVVVGVAAAGLWIGGLIVRDPSAAAPSGTADRAPTATAEVTRQTLSQTRTFHGTLGYGSSFTLTASTQGTVTRTSDEGEAIARGGELYRVDERPTVAIFGSIPAYRDLRPGDEGADVEEFEENLAALGYGGFDIDDTFTWATSRAVRQWQADSGMDVTGTVDASSIAAVPEGSRVDAFHVRPGSRVAPGTAVLDVTGSSQAVTIDIATRDRDLFATGTGISVHLPAAGSVSATVTSVTAKPSPSPDGQGTESGEGDVDAAVEASLAKSVDVGLLGTPVDVEVVIATHENVLTVPVNALLALTSGGYGVEVVGKSGKTTVVPVTTGLFATGRVEVDGVEDGATVAVPQR